MISLAGNEIITTFSRALYINNLEYLIITFLQKKKKMQFTIAQR